MPQRHQNEARMIEISEEVETIQQTADRAQRELTHDELERVNALHNEFRQLDAGAQVAGIRAAMSAGTGRVTDPAVPGTSIPHPVGALDSTTRPAFYGRRYVDLFGATRERPSFEGFAKYLRAVHLNDIAEIRNANGMSEGVGSEGGFMVPMRVAAMINDMSLAEEVIRPRATVYPLEGPSLMVPAFDHTDRSVGVARIAMQWLGEGSSGTPQKPKMRSITLAAKKAAVYVPVTRELLEDAAPAMDRILGELFVREIGRGLDKAFMAGTGAGQPIGILESSSLVTVSKEGSQTAATIVSANLQKMMARLLPGAWSNAVWLAHPSCLSQLLQVSVPLMNANATSQTNAAFAPALIEPGGRMSLNGRPLIVTDHCAPLGTVGDILLVDLSQYLIGQRGELRIEASPHLYFATDEVAFRAILRIDGLPAANTAVTPVKGTDTLSWAIALETRA